MVEINVLEGCLEIYMCCSGLLIDYFVLKIVFIGLMVCTETHERIPIRRRNLKKPVRCQWHPKVEKLSVKFMTTFKVMVVKTKFIVAKCN